MPASRLVLVATLLAILVLANIPTLSHSDYSTVKPVGPISLTPPSTITSALNWLEIHQYPNGSYGQYFEGQAAAAAYALWLNDSGSRNAAITYSYLAGQLEDPQNSMWFESDVPGEVLFSLAITGHLGLIHNMLGVSSRFLQLQEITGGFEGYYNITTMRTLTSSVDTAMALWGLSNAKAIPSQNQTAAVNYLLTLQNPDGGFNLTRNGAADTAYSLGPDRTSITALVALVLRDNGSNPRDPSILKALDFLSQTASAGFNGQGHVYDAALSTLAFLQYYRPHEAVISMNYLMTQQNIDGGFGDVTRFTPGSNALDTGWAAAVLQFGSLERVTTGGYVNRPPTSKFTFNPEQPTNSLVVSFDGGSSYDPDGDSLSYAWTFGDGASATGVASNHIYAREGNYTVTLTVTDTRTNPGYLSSTTWHTITVTKSTGPARTASMPLSSLNILELAGIFVLAALLVGSLVFRIRKRRKLKK